MQNDKNELERKALNKKLLKNSFFSELKNIKNLKINIVFCLIDILTIFSAFYFTDLIKEIFSISSFFIRLGIVVIIGKIIDFLIKKIIFKIKEKIKLHS